MIEKRREDLRQKHVTIISYFAGVFVVMILLSVGSGMTVEEVVAVYPIACVFFGAVLCLFAGLVLPFKKARRASLWCWTVGYYGVVLGFLGSLAVNAIMKLT